MRRILWLTVNAATSHSSLAMPITHQAAAIPGWEWHHRQVTCADDASAIAAEIAALQPDMVTATLYLFNRQAVGNIMARLRALLPKTLLVGGGPECLGEGARQVLLEWPWMDFTIHGEAEAVFPHLLQCLDERLQEKYDKDSDFPAEALRQELTCAVAGIAGIIHRHSPPEADLAPPPIYEGWVSAPPPPLDPFYCFNKPFVQVETARGCPGRCIFCTSGGTKVRYRPLPAVRQELTLLAQNGLREVRLLDRTFNLPDGRAAELLRLFREEFPRMRFHLELHPALLGKELRRELLSARPGQLHIEAGIQSLEPAVLKALGRNDSPQAALEGLTFLCKLPGVAVHTDLIGGCPGQSLAGIFQDLQQLLAINPEEIQLEIMKILPGTTLRHNAAVLGVDYSPLPPYEVLRTTTMSPADLQRCRLLSRMVDCFANHPDLGEAFRYAALADKQFLHNALELLEKEHGFNIGPAPALRRRFLMLQQVFSALAIAGEALALLAEGWLRCMFPPGEGPATAARYCRTPEGHSGKCVELPLSGRPMKYFLYDRAISTSRAIQEWSGYGAKD